MFVPLSQYITVHTGEIQCLNSAKNIQGLESARKNQIISKTTQSG